MSKNKGIWVAPSWPLRPLGGLQEMRRIAAAQPPLLSARPQGVNVRDWDITLAVVGERQRAAAVGAPHNLTRERVRQICAQVFDALRIPREA